MQNLFSIPAIISFGGVQLQRLTLTSNWFVFRKLGSKKTIGIIGL